MFPAIPESIEYIRDGRLRALAVTTAERSDVLPDTPILADYVPGVEASFWTGVAAPKNTPVKIIEMLNKEINASLRGDLPTSAPQCFQARPPTLAS
jgi:tripartite-type tricarboxylate transporter receptor subunit TctC